MAAQAVFADPAYGNYGKVETLRSVPVDATLGDAGAPMPAVTGAGEIVVRTPNAKVGVVCATDYGFSITNADNAAAIARALAASGTVPGTWGPISCPAWVCRPM